MKIISGDAAAAREKDLQGGSARLTGGPTGLGYQDVPDPKTGRVGCEPVGRIKKYRWETDPPVEAIQAFHQNCQRLGQAGWQGQILGSGDVVQRTLARRQAEFQKMMAKAQTLERNQDGTGTGNENGNGNVADKDRSEPAEGAEAKDAGAKEGDKVEKQADKQTESRISSPGSAAAAGTASAASEGLRGGGAAEAPGNDDSGSGKQEDGGKKRRKKKATDWQVASETEQRVAERGLPPPFRPIYLPHAADDLAVAEFLASPAHVMVPFVDFLQDLTSQMILVAMQLYADCG